MNTKTTSFRIHNSLNQQALVWPISPFMYAVKWEDQDDTKTLPKSTVDSVIKDGTWKIVLDVVTEKELPDTFKFTCGRASHDTVYTYTKTEQGDNITWNKVSVRVEDKYVKNFIKAGSWSVVEESLAPDVMNYCYEILSKVAPDEDEEYYEKKYCSSGWEDGVEYKKGDKFTMDGVTFEIYGNKSKEFLEAQQEYEKKYTAATKLSTLEAIKEFVEYSDHYVVLEKDYYAVYRDGEDDAYKCYDDESLISVMNALSVLDIHEEKPMYYTLNLEGIV